MKRQKGFVDGVTAVLWFVVTIWSFSIGYIAGEDQQKPAVAQTQAK